METAFVLETLILVIFTIEYISLLIYILLKIKTRRTQDIKTTPIQRMYLILVLIMLISRVCAFGLIFIEPDFYKIFLSINYLTTFIIYSFIAYYWYNIYRSYIYLTNCFHISTSCKKPLLLKAKRCIIVLDAIVVISYLVIVGLDYEKISFQIIGPPVTDSSLGFKIHLFSCVWGTYLGLMAIGCLLLKQISKFYTEKPLYLIISLYVILAGFTFAAITMTLPEFVPEFFTFGVKIAVSLLYVHLVDIIPQFLFHKQIVTIQKTKTKESQVISFLDEMII